MQRPDFSQISSYEEFCTYYWYQKELKAICKQLGLAHSGNKQELENIIAAYFRGNKIKPVRTRQKALKMTSDLSLKSPLLTCGFAFNQKFRDYFGQQTGVKPFKFTADMAAAWRKVKADHDTSFTIQDLLDLYAGKSTYARYDNRVCQWNQFYKDFCADKRNAVFKSKMAVAALLWQEVKKRHCPKVYSPQLVEDYQELITSFLN